MIKASADGVGEAEGWSSRGKGSRGTAPMQHTKARRDILSSVKQNSIDM